MALKANYGPERSSSRQRSRADLDHLSLVVGRVDLEFATYPVERDYRQFRAVPRRPGVLARVGSPDIIVTVQRTPRSCRNRRSILANGSSKIASKSLHKYPVAKCSRPYSFGNSNPNASRSLPVRVAFVPHRSTGTPRPNLSPGFSNNPIIGAQMNGLIH